jgi:tRNA pseudouridine13 synthase
MSADLLKVALAPPRVHGEPLSRAVLKSTAEDFIVDEVLGFAADGGSGQRLIQVEKRGIDTLHAVRLLARYVGVAPRDVGFAGLKDRHAVARQWFTVPAGRQAPDWTGLTDERLRVLSDAPQSRKLRRGALRGNRFTLRLREVDCDRQALAERVALIASVGVPNYFGPQRFGRDGDNVRAVADWIAGAPLPRAREARAFVYSSARSLLFNAALAARVADGTWNRLLEGERVNLAGRNSWFTAEAIDEVLLDRLGRFDIHPTGPMPGRGEGPGGEAGAREAAVLEPYADMVAALAAEGVDASRRALRLHPEDFEVSVEGDAVLLSFSLTAGSYATMVVRELFETDTFGEGGDDAPG